MKKSVLAAGLLLILGGLVSASLFSYSKVNIETDFKEVQQEWNIPPMNCSQGDIISLSFWPQSEWSIDPGPSSGMWEAYWLPPGPNSTLYPYVKLFEINITNPLNNFTFFTIYLIVETRNYGPIYVFTDYIEYFGNGGLISGKGYTMAGSVTVGLSEIHLGKAPVDGLYSAKCSLYPETVWDIVWEDKNGDGVMQDDEKVPDPHRVSPPLLLRLSRHWTETEYPYRSRLLLPLSISTIIVGGILMTWSMRSRKQKRYKAIGEATAGEVAKSKTTKHFRKQFIGRLAFPSLPKKP